MVLTAHRTTEIGSINIVFIRGYVGTDTVTAEGLDSDPGAEDVCRVCVVVRLMNRGRVETDGKDGASGRECALSVVDKKVIEVLMMFSQVTEDSIFLISKDSTESRDATRRNAFVSRIVMDG